MGQPDPNIAQVRNLPIIGICTRESEPLSPPLHRSHHHPSTIPQNDPTKRMGLIVAFEFRFRLLPMFQPVLFARRTSLLYHIPDGMSAWAL